MPDLGNPQISVFECDTILLRVQQDALASGNNLHLSKADREFRYRRDITLLEQQNLRQSAASARATRLSSRTASPSPTLSTVNPDTTSTSPPSTPTISTPSDLTPSPEPRPILLPAFFTPTRVQAPRQQTQTKISAAESDNEMTKPVDLFRGNGTAEKAHMWLRMLEQTFKYDSDEKEKAYRFEKGLYPGSDAEEWWGKLQTNEKTVWKDLLDAFEKKWPKPKTTKRAQEIVISELMENHLDRSVLGQLVKDEDGTLVLSHVAWSEVTRRLLGEIEGGDATMMLRSSIRKTLPVEFRALIQDDSSLDTWDKWLRAVEAVSVDRIRDAAEARSGGDVEIQTWVLAHPGASREERPVPSREDDAPHERLRHARHHELLSVDIVSVPRPSQPQSPQQQRATPAHMTPVRAYQSAQSTPQGPRTPWAQRTQDNVFGGSTLRPINTFAKSLQAPPSTPSPSTRAHSFGGDPSKDLEIAGRIYQNPRTFAEDATGVQAYTRELATWTTQNSGPSPDYTSYPLAPGTVGMGSKECFRCGKITNPPHYGKAACEARGSTPLSVKEQNLRTWSTPEEKWEYEEIARIARRGEKEKQCKAKQLLRRAEQPLPFPGLGYSPPPRTEPKPRIPRPFPMSGERAQIPAATDAAVNTQVDETPGEKDRYEKDPEEQLEDEWERISLIRLSRSPWAETRFAKYLAVDLMLEADTFDADEHPGNDEKDQKELNATQIAKLARQRANRLWNDTLAVAARENAEMPTREQPVLPAREQRLQRDEADSERWKLHQQAKALGNMLQMSVGPVKSEAQLQSLVTSEIRIRRLRNKLDEMKAMAGVENAEGGEQAEDIHVIGDTSNELRFPP
ncbi:hypothetical protein C8J57DRAFT_1633748 [Mycena rebaudengoi]|nr:hypothetical protein C8J57DRAFT_1633748 [Mycena rebaudengoi]